MTVKDKPLVCEDEDDDDDDIWTKVAPCPPSVGQDLDDVSSLTTPLSVKVRDEFLPIPLDEDDMDDVNTADVGKVIKKLEDSFASIIKNPRLHCLCRLGCFCHLLQVYIIYDDIHDFISLSCRSYLF